MCTRALLFFSALTLALLAAWGHRLDRPWTAGTDQMGARYSVIARNFVATGFKDLEQRTHCGAPPPGIDYSPYTNHPPLVPLAIAVAFRVFDTDAAWAARLSVAPAALGCLLLLGLLARLAGRRRLGAAALLVAVVAPVSCFYGLFPDPVGWWFVLFQLAFVVLLKPWLVPGGDEPGLGRGLAIAAIFLAGMMAEWHMALMLPIFAMAWLAGRRRGGLVVWLPLVAAVPLALFIYRVLLPAPEGVGYAFVLRKLAAFSHWGPEFWAGVGHYLVVLYGWPLLGLAAAGLIGLLARTLGRRSGGADRTTWTLLAFYAMVTTIYPNAALFHDYFHAYALPGLALLAGGVLLRFHDALRVRLGARAGSVVAGIALAAIAMVSVHRALERDRVWDAYVPRILVESRLVRDAVRADEVVASTIGLDVNESIAYYANRMVFPRVNTPATVRALRRSPWSAAAFVAPRRDLSSYPELISFLDANWPRREHPFHRVYDLRGAPRSTGGDSQRSRASDPGAPQAVSCRVIGSRVEVRWKPIEDPRVIGYRVFGGAAPRLPLGQMDVDAPPCVIDEFPPGVVYVVVAPRFADGRIGARSEDVCVEVLTAEPLTEHILAIALAFLVTTAAYGFVLVRGRPGTEPGQELRGESLPA